jgi:nuclear pore complex protein Nup107
MYREDQLAVGPEVEAFAIKLDDCLSGFPGVDLIRDRVIRLVNDLFDYAVLQLGPLESLDPEVRCNDDAATQKYHHWKEEARTWDLLRRLLPIRYPSGSHYIPPTEECAAIHQAELNHHPIWRDFLSVESSAVEGAAILQWAQQNYSDKGSHTSSLHTDPQSSNIRGKIHTKSAIKSRKRLISTESSHTNRGGFSCLPYLTNDDNPLITQLDPDAATRQQRQLQPADDESDLQLSQSLFYRLRWEHDASGIRDLCEAHGEVWRVAAMVDFPPRRKGEAIHFRDPDSLSCELAPLVLWRRMCFHLCRQGGKNYFERAVYGILAGDIRSVELLCENWDDLVFTHFNCLIRSQFDDYLIRLNVAGQDPSFRRMFLGPDTPSLRDHADIIRAIESHPLAALHSPAPLKALQASIISGELEDHFHRQGAVLALEANSDGPSQLMPRAGEPSEDARRIKFIGLGDHAELRVLAHVFFIISILDRLHESASGVSLGEEVILSKQQTRENILVGYIGFLRLAGLEDIIPLYCSELSEPRVYEVLHTNLIHVTDTASRSRYLDLMRKASIDPLKFVVAQSGMMIDALPKLMDSRFDLKIVERGDRSLKHGQSIKTDFFGGDSENMDNADDLLIRVVEWQLLVDEAWPNLFSVLIRLYTHFLRKSYIH